MDKSKKLIAGVVATLLILATSATMSTPAYAVSGADIVSRGKTTVYIGQATLDNWKGRTWGDLDKLDQNLAEGVNIINQSADNIRYVKNGQVIKGWFKPDDYYNMWSYSDELGRVVRNKWIKQSDKWYYVGAQGVMLRNANVDGYYLGFDGSCQGKAKENLDDKIYTLFTSTGGYTNIWLTAEEFESKLALGKIKPIILYSGFGNNIEHNANTACVEFCSN